MGLVTQTKTIAGHEWAVTQLPAMRALKLEVVVFRAVGPALAAAASGGANLEAALQSGALAKATSLLCDRLSPDELESVIRQVFETATRDGKPVMPGFDETFRGNLTEVLQALGFALEMNFGFDFGDLAARFAAGPKAAAPP